MTARDRAWGWVNHLEDGGTTPWTAWTGSGAAGPRALPGAQQLELLRRVNQRARPPRRLVDRVLAASAPGRGRPDLGLVGVRQQRFGPPPVDPAALPESELLRVATGLIAEDLVAAGDPPLPAARRPRRRRRRYRLAGDPWLVRPFRAALVAAGRPPGGPGATIHVLGTDLATMLRDSWTTGAFAEGGPPWPDFLAGLRRRNRVARRVDLPAIAQRWRRTPGPAGVDVVLDLDALPRLVGARGTLTRQIVGDESMAGQAVELARQTVAALGVLVVPARRAELLGGWLLPELSRVPGPPVAVPETHREWVDEQAAAMRRSLLRGGYAVVGDPDQLLPRWDTQPAGPGNVDLGEVLDLAIELLLRPVGPKEVS